MPPLILASQSPARKRLLKRLGFRFRAIPSHFDEESVRGAPRKKVAALALAKARTLFERYPHALVIGSDQMLVLGRRVFGKPQTRQKAIEQLRAFSGKTAELLTAVALLGPRSKVSCFTNVTRMTFRKLSIQEITDYVDLDVPLECAGSFMFEKNGLRLFEKVETSDPTAIEGLPCLELASRLRYALNE